MSKERESYFRFMVCMAVTTYEFPHDNVISAKTAVNFVQWVIDLAMRDDDDSFSVEMMENYPASGKYPLLIRVCGEPQYLMWFYPNKNGYAICDDLVTMLQELSAIHVCVPV